MARALLINPSYFRIYGTDDGGLVFPVYPLLNLMAIGGALSDRGHDYTILDLSYREYEPGVIRDLLQRERPDIVGVTATTPLANQARDISFLVKDVLPEALTIAGGAHPSALPQAMLRESALDFVACGEADFTIADLLDGTPPADIPGLWWHDGDRFTTSGQVRLLEDLDRLPMPAWEDYPKEGEAGLGKAIARHMPVTTIEFSRGCIYGCDFCASKSTLGRGYRKKSPERCAEELEHLHRLGYREVVLMDDIFTTDNNWAAEVCEAIIRKGPKVAWTASNGLRVDSVNSELFDLMKRAGCYRAFFGFETGNEDVLKAFGKGGRASIEKGVEAVEMARDAGIEPNGFFMVGLTGDTEASMQDTIDYTKKVRLDTMKCGITVPFPGTPMFQGLARDGRIKTLDWDVYTVYNNAEEIFDHPTLEWETIRRYFKKFYRQTYLNPGYVSRRARFMVRNREVLSNLWYGMKLWRMLFRRTPTRTRERYAYADRWRPLDSTLDEVAGEEQPVPVARREGTALKLAAARRAS